MDEQVKKLARILKFEYGLFILIPVLLCCFYESDWLSVGYYAHDVQIQYAFGTIGILLALLFTPLSLKLFNTKLVKKIKEAPLDKALKLYKVYSEIRIGMLFAVVLTNIMFYYLTLQNMGVLCAFIGLIASLFCIPSEQRIKQELELIKQI